MKSLAVIVITYRIPGNLLKKLLELFYHCGFSNKQVFIRDNTNNNIGYGAAINEIIKKRLRDFDNFLILNPDISFNEDCFQKLLETLNTSDDIGIVGPLILDREGKIWSIGGSLDKKRYSARLLGYREEESEQYKKPIDVEYVSGTAMLVKRVLFETIGLFKEDYFLYYEDVDFCLRARKAGFHLVVNPQSKITHDASSSVGENSSMMQYYLARNHLLFVERFAPWHILFREYIRLPKTLFEHYMRNEKYAIIGIKDYFLRRFGKSDYWS